jgi:hypothetical protein
MRNRCGFALITVMLLMAVGTALIVGAMNSSLAESEVSRAGTLQRRALVGAESELLAVVGSLAPATLRGRPLGMVSASSRTVGDMTLIVTVDKVDTSVVWTVATATIRRSGMVARHRLGMTSLIPRDSTDPLLHPVPERAWVELF